MNKLKPCPFCGGEDIEIQTLHLMPDGFVSCKSCGATIDVQIRNCYNWKKKLVKALIESWNRREKG